MADATVERTLKDLTSLPVEEKSGGVELTLTSAQEQELGNYLRMVYLQMKGDRVPLEREWADNVQREESVFPAAQGPWPGSSDIRPPLTRVVKDTLHALYRDSLCGQSSKLRCTPTRQDDAGKAHKNESFMNYQLDEEIMFDDLADKFILDFCGPTGNAFLEPRYTVETEERKEEIVTEEPENPDDPESPLKKTTKTKTYEEIIFDGVKVDLISSEFIFSAPIWENASEAAERDVLIKVMPQSIEEIRRKLKGMTPKYHNAEAFEFLVGKKEPNLVQLAKWKIDNITKNYLRDRIVINTAECYLWWKINDPIDKSQTKMERLIVTLDIDSGTVFRIIKARCRIVHLKPFLVRGRFWGRSPHILVKAIQKHLDAITNQLVDAGSLANFPCGFYRGGGTWNPQTFSIAPAQFQPVENPGDVGFIPTPRVDNSFQLQAEKCWEWIERLFGLNENIQGLQNEKSTTATEAIQVSQRASVKFGAPFKRVISQLKPLFYHVHDLNQQFTPPEKTFRILGRDGVFVFQKFTSTEAKARLNFEFEVQTIYDEQLMRDTWMLAWHTWYPILQAAPAYAYRLTQKAMQSVIGDTTAFLPVPEEAKLPSAEEAIELLLQGEKIDPQPGIDPVHYLRVLAAFIDSDDFKELTNLQQHSIFDFFAKTKLMKEIMDKYNLNNSGIYAPPGMAGPMPPSGISVGRQPSQKFNTMKIGQGRGATNGNAMGTNQNGLPQPQPFGR